jgi:hypothetical protein
MISLLNVYHTWPRIGTVTLRVGALALVFYGASFYTRDWRSVVPDVGQPAQAQAAFRPKAAPQTAPAKASEPPAPIEPATTGTLPRITATAPDPAAVETLARPMASALPRAKAKPAAPRSPVRQEQSKRTQVAAASSVKQPSLAGPLSSAPETPVQFRLAERGN